MKILICGTRGCDLTDEHKKLIYDTLYHNELVEGCCPDSPDVIAESIADKMDIFIHHFPSYSGNYIKRNIEMVALADEILAFWDGISYGTAHTIASGIKKGIKVTIIEVKKREK